MSSGQTEDSETDHSGMPSDFDRLLASSNSEDAQAWNVGLLLGIVSMVSHGLRFDATTKSTRLFQYYCALLQSAACLLANTVERRESIVTRIDDYIRGIESSYGSEGHAESLTMWSRGELESEDLRITTPEPPNLGILQGSIEGIVTEPTKPAFLAGFVCGNAWAQCQYQLRDDLPKTLASKVFIAAVIGNTSDAVSGHGGVGRMKLELEFETRMSSLFRAQGWNSEDWYCVMFESGRSEQKWVQLRAIDAGMNWVSRRIEMIGRPEDESVDDRADRKSRAGVVSHVTEKSSASDGFTDASYLGVSYSEVARAVRRDGFDSVIRFEGQLIPWHVFRMLIRCRDQWSNRDTLRPCWEEAGRSRPVSGSDNSIDQTICVLRNMLKVINLNIQNSPKSGWRISNKAF